MKTILFSLALIAFNAHAVTDEFLNARADRAAEQAAQNPIRTARAIVTIRKSNGLDSEAVIHRTVNVPVIDENKANSQASPALINLGMALTDGRKVEVEVQVEARLATVTEGQTSHRVKTLNGALAIKNATDAHVLYSKQNKMSADLYRTSMTMTLVTMDMPNNEEAEKALGNDVFNVSIELVDSML